MSYLIAALLLLSTFTKIEAQEFDTRPKLVEELYKQARESPTAIGINQHGHVIEIFVSPNQSWTMIVTLPNGQSKVLMVGEGWDYWKDRVAMEKGL